MTRRFLTFLLDILPGLVLLAALALALLLMLPTPRGEPQTDLGSSGGAAVLPGAPEKVPASLATAGRVAVSMGDSDGSGAPPPQAAIGGGAATRAGLAIGTSSARPAPSVDASSCVTPCYVAIGYLVRTGIASTYGPRFSEWWVALPDGPGWRFTVCGAGGCRTLVSTDSGPSRAMQRAPYNRVVDLPVGAFSDVCGVSWTMGLCQVSLTMLGRA